MGNNSGVKYGASWKGKKGGEELRDRGVGGAGRGVEGAGRGVGGAGRGVGGGVEG